METPEQSGPAVPQGVRIKVFGVGNAGLNILEHVMKSCATRAEFASVNTDNVSLLGSSAPEKISLESRLMRGLGTGGDPERGRAAAEQNVAVLKAACTGVDVVFIVTGLGGGAGSGISPVLARTAREAGALVLAFATLPFDCEGNRRHQQARASLHELKSAADGVLCLPNQKLFKLIDENATVLETFRLSNELVSEGACGMARLVLSKGLIEIHFADLCDFLRERQGESCYATAEGAGATRSREVVDKLLVHPMLDSGKALAEASAVLVSVVAGTDLTMAEINRVMEHINGKCTHAEVIMGAAVDPGFADRMSVTLVAVRRAAPAELRPQAEAEAPATARATEMPFDTQLHRASTARPQSRFVPPPPAMSPERMEQLASTQAGSRGRKSAPRLRQTQLPLEIVSKGRFDKSEPTIHKGEDLDVPTYIRRGIALN
ncbi:MAG TPA: cell division protein FtsZ [Verrucomicrobiae bacterium]|nr:cell division protein FtsZ [Verrucomicrobiae bacterium]